MLEEEQGPSFRLISKVNSEVGFVDEEQNRTGPLAVIVTTTEPSFLDKTILFLFPIAICLVATVAVSITSYHALQKAHLESFLARSNESFSMIIERFQSTAIPSKLLALESLGLAITSYASLTNRTWPFVTIPDFDKLGMNALALSDSSSVEIFPLVRNHQRRKWEVYSYSSRKQHRHPTVTDQTGNKSIAPTIFTFLEDTDQKVVSDVEPVYFPMWQNYPINHTLSNFNLYSDATFHSVIDQTLHEQVAILGPILEAISEQSKPPQSTILMPLFDRLNYDGRSVVGVVRMVFRWDFSLVDTLPPSSKALHIVLYNDCDQVYTYEINGTATIFLGEGDRHDRTFDDNVVTSTIVHPDFLYHPAGDSKGSPQPLHKTIQDDCQYSINIYPTRQFHHPNDEHGWMDTMVVIGVPCVSSLICMIAIAIYGIAIRRQQLLLASEKAESDAVLSTIFPSGFREHLLSRAPSKDFSSEIFRLREEDLIDAEKPSLVKRISAAIPSKETLMKKLQRNQVGPEQQKKHLAKSFPETTILFAEIDGFQAWSSQRDPSEVFVLLQTVYNAFDAIAKRHKVFKVETVGDCYVAATGVPEHQADHAVRLTSFAKACMHHINMQNHDLELKLGPDTGDLKLRIGLHSGPILAGVLDREKAQFQLFGDTMNMAARMESTGKRNHIQCSASTAELLRAADKESWLLQRDELVTAKGKGQVRTYWVLPGKDDTEGAASEHEHQDFLNFIDEVGDDDDDDEDLMGSQSSSGIMDLTWGCHRLLERNSRFQRLIDWNVNLLMQHLRRIETKRRHSVSISKKTIETCSSDRDNDPLDSTSRHSQHATTALDELAESITLPSFDAAEASVQHNNNSTDCLAKDAQFQLKNYVATIADMYQRNAFHNFEHASHVTMSTNKLLKRILTPQQYYLHHAYFGGIGDLKEKDDALASDLHEFSYGITSDPLTQFALIFCALIHDVDHSGVSNFELIKENPVIAKIYKNRSVAEQNSVDVAWDLLMDPSYSALQKAIWNDDPNEMKRFRQLVVNIVLATDVFDKGLKNFRERRWRKAFETDSEKQNLTARSFQTVAGCGKSRSSTEFSQPSSYKSQPSSCKSQPERQTPTSRGQTPSSDSFSLADVTNLKATIVIEHLIQASDVAHTMQHWDIYLKWNERLFNEMYVAYEQKRSCKDPTRDWYEGEILFFDKYIIPLAKKLASCGVFGVASDEYLNYAKSNRKQWAVEGKEVVAGFSRDLLNRRQKKQMIIDEKGCPHESSPHTAKKTAHKPDVTKTDIDKPEVNKTDIDKPEVNKSEVNQPNVKNVDDHYDDDKGDDESVNEPDEELKHDIDNSSTCSISSTTSVTVLA